MNISELTLRKITDYYEDKDDIVTAKMTITKELMPEKCTAEGDIITLVFTDGTKSEFDLWDCNTDYEGGGVSLNTKDERYAYIS